jgi:hypothetical protein
MAWKPPRPAAVERAPHVEVVTKQNPHNSGLILPNHDTLTGMDDARDRIALTGL